MSRNPERYWLYIGSSLIAFTYAELVRGLVILHPTSISNLQWFQLEILLLFLCPDFLTLVSRAIWQKIRVRVKKLTTKFLFNTRLRFILLWSKLFRTFLMKNSAFWRDHAWNKVRRLFEWGMCFGDGCRGKNEWRKSSFPEASQNAPYSSPSSRR